ncbi:mitochondrial carrier domain-containing protein [Podospora appendiculata]|uniref:Mitochondrial carrier domain-containing protein n=1 Tax=Podospora appendiculata TaxID=314037 RepID=A0AAE0X4X3_9PEZI|nr:mitochondrial carrier domain-containing protein [Podospora appendiculata]
MASFSSHHHPHHHNDEINPLRPYYIPPSIGEPPESIPTPGPRAFAHGNSTGKYASKARDIFSDIDYKGYLAEPSPSVVQTVKDLVDELLWKYTSVLMAQPFEVAKTIMQIRSQDDPGGLAAAAAAEQTRQAQVASQRISMYDDEIEEDVDSDSDLDEMAYFASNHPSTPTPGYPRSRRPRQQSPIRTPQTPTPKPLAAHQLAIRTPDSVLEVIAQLWQKESAWGVWKGANATFIYSVLQSLLENWSRSLLGALFNVPDLGVRNDMDRLIDLASPYPWASLLVAAAAAVVTGLVLSPLDLVRTRLIITSTSHGSRRTLSTLRNLPSYFCPSGLFIPTVLHSLVHPLFMLSTPLVLRSRFMIEREVSPVTFSIAKFCSSTVALFIKLPLETALRRGQAAVLSSPPYVQALDAQPTAQGKKSTTATHDKLETVIPVGAYRGVFGTMYSIVNEEGSHALPTASRKNTTTAAAAAARKGKPTVAETVYRRGQGLDGLWRGWKVGWWGLVGLWTAGVLGGGGDGEF